MPKYHGLPDYIHNTPAKLGVLLVNLGTPAEPTASSLRRFLRKFLSDPRVVELPRPLWWIILNLVILNIRPAQSARSYKKIWTEQGSPLMCYSRRLKEKVNNRIKRTHADQITVELAMSYSEPEISTVVTTMHDQGVRSLLVVPLYPQYSCSTTASVFDAVSKCLSKFRWIPEFHFVNDYHSHDGYLSALADKIRHHWRENEPGERLLMSFHGVPKRYLESGDPYHCFCHASARLLAQKLELTDSQWQVTFQSRFGREPWLQPATDKTLEQLPQSGVASVDIVCPGFAVDCLETLEEINMENRQLFLSAGGRRFNYIECLNDSDGHVEFLSDLISVHGANFISHLNEYDRQTPARARALGAKQ